MTTHLQLVPRARKCGDIHPTVRSIYQGTTGEDTADFKDLECSVVI
jgi:hypothetical protein